MLLFEAWIRLDINEGGRVSMLTKNEQVQEGGFFAKERWVSYSGDHYQRFESSFAS